MLTNECPLPGCRRPTDTPGLPCPTCQTELADFLRPCAGEPETNEQVLARTAETGRVQTLALTPPPAVERQELEWRQNQTCWLCRSRRIYARTAQGWECRSCLQVT